MDTNNKIVLLFYKDFEKDSMFKNDRYLKRIIRPIYHTFSKRPKVSGFYIWYQLLIKALRQQGYEVRINDHKFAKSNPKHPVGLVGYPHLLNDWILPNPALLGPSLFDHPKNYPDLFNDSRNKLYIVTCDWMKRMFDPYYGSRCVQWYAGMDTDLWNDTKAYPKSTDVLIYDKIRWNRNVYIESLIAPITKTLEDRNLSYQIIQYGHYDHNTYKKLLTQSRSLIFLCEHETQGMAYQEAMASNVPILAWENGFWLDPNRERFSSNPVPASSVPYFSSECGERFKDSTDFQETFDVFWSQLNNYQPRRFVQRELSLEGSANLYMKYYSQIAGM